MAKEKDINGFWTIADNPISKEGVFDYLGKEIGAPNKDDIYKVYRPASELSREETIKSFCMLPFIDDHTFLGVDGKSPEEVGVMGITGDDVVFDAPYLKSTLRIFGDHLKRAIEGGKVELSPSYRCNYKFEPGVFDGQEYDAIQTDIRGNHLALVDKGRTGPDVRVWDCYAFDGELTKDEDVSTKEDVEMLTEDQLKQIQPLIVAAVKVAMDEAKKEKPKDEEKPADEEEEKKEEASDEEEEKAKDLSEEEIEELKEKAAEDARSATIKQINARDKLAKQVEPHIGAFDHSSFTCDSEVAVYAIGKLGISAPSGQEIPYLQGYLANNKPAKDSIVSDSYARKPTAKSIVNRLWGIK